MAPVDNACIFFVTNVVVFLKFDVDASLPRDALHSADYRYAD